MQLALGRWQWNRAATATTIEHRDHVERRLSPVTPRTETHLSSRFLMKLSMSILSIRTKSPTPTSPWFTIVGVVSFLVNRRATVKRATFFARRTEPYWEPSMSQANCCSPTLPPLPSTDGPARGRRRAVRAPVLFLLIVLHNQRHEANASSVPSVNPFTNSVSRSILRYGRLIIAMHPNVAVW